jgi:excisionase family DNA binding protein
VSGLAFPVPDELVEAIAERVAELLEQRHGSHRASESPWLSIADGASYLSISERQLQRAITKGRISSATIGRRRLLHRDELDRFARAAGEE